MQAYSYIITHLCYKSCGILAYTFRHFEWTPPIQLLPSSTSYSTILLPEYNWLRKRNDAQCLIRGNEQLVPSTTISWVIDCFWQVLANKAFNNYKFSPNNKLLSSRNGSKGIVTLRSTTEKCLIEFWCPDPDILPHKFGVYKSFQIHIHRYVDLILGKGGLASSCIHVKEGTFDKIQLKKIF